MATDFTVIQQLTEEEFTKKYVMPLFSDRGYEDVRYIHGQDEFGRDVICYKRNDFGIIENTAIQVKKGKQTLSDAGDLVDDVKQAFSMPYYDPLMRENRKIQTLYFITSGTFTEKCLKYIEKNTPQYASVRFMDGHRVLTHSNKIISSYLEYSKADKIMRDISVFSLSLDPSFLKEVDELVVYLTKDEKVSPLHCINILPKLLIAKPIIKSKLSGKDELDQKSILHWFSIMLIVKAWKIYGKSKKFSVIEDD